MRDQFRGTSENLPVMPRLQDRPAGPQQFPQPPRIVRVVVAGPVFEAVADAQLQRFRASPAQRGKVLDTGLWRYSRHPNYFGECCVWWGLWLLAAAAGAWWTILSPLLMTVLLLRVSGVTLLEADIGQRRPAYADYMRRTSAFVPGQPR